MTDRELLELAARAAGWSGWRSKHGHWIIESPDGYKTVCCEHWQAFDGNTGEKQPEPTFADAMSEANWSPLTDDGDALRLAVKLGMKVMSDTGASMASATTELWSDEGYCEGFSMDPCAATRRAIVRAAAEIGKAMP